MARTSRSKSKSKPKAKQTASATATSTLKGKFQQLHQAHAARQQEQKLLSSGGLQLTSTSKSSKKKKSSIPKNLEKNQTILDPEEALASVKESGIKKIAKRERDVFNKSKAPEFTSLDFSSNSMNYNQDNQAIFQRDSQVKGIETGGFNSLFESLETISKVPEPTKNANRLAARMADDSDDSDANDSDSFISKHQQQSSLFGGSSTNKQHLPMVYPDDIEEASDDSLDDGLESSSGDESESDIVTAQARARAKAKAKAKVQAKKTMKSKSSWPSSTSKLSSTNNNNNNNNEQSTTKDSMSSLSDLSSALNSQSHQKQSPSTQQHLHPSKRTQTYSAFEIFSSVYEKRSSNEPTARLVYSILSVVEEQIISKITAQTGSAPPTSASPVAYLAGLLDALSSILSQARAHHSIGQEGEEFEQDSELNSIRSRQAATLYLLSLLVPKLPLAVLNSAFSKSRIVHESLMISPTPQTLKPGLSVITYFLIALTPRAWEQQAALELFRFILTQSLSANSKVRKRSIEGAASILSEPKLGTKVRSSISILFVQFISSLFEALSSNKSDARALYHGLSLTKRLIPLLSTSAASKTLSELSNLATNFSSDNEITANIYEVIAPVFSSQSSSQPTQSLMVDSLALLMSIAPATMNSAHLCETFCRITTQGLVSLATHHPKIVQDRDLSPRLFKKLVTFFDSTHEQVRIAATQNCALLIKKTIFDSQIQIALSSMSGAAPASSSLQPKSTIVGSIIQTTSSLFAMRFEDSWDLTLIVVAELFNRLGRHSISLLSDFVPSLISLHSVKGKYTGALRLAIGAAITAFGAPAFLALVPLNIFAADGRLNEPEQTNDWLLPLLKDYATNTQLSYFTSTLVPLAQRLLEQSMAAAERGAVSTAKNMRSQYTNIWSLFPSFCSYATDIPSCFPNAAPGLLNLIQTEPYLRSIVCKGLQQLIAKLTAIVSYGDTTEQQQSSSTPSLAQTENPQSSLPEPLTRDHALASLQTIALSAPEFIPALFNAFIEVDGSVRSTIHEAIESFVPISGSEAMSHFFRSVVEQLISAQQQQHQQQHTAAQETRKRKHDMTDLSAVFVPVLDAQSISLLYQVIKPQLLERDDPTLQKKAYKVLSVIADYHSDWVSADLADITSTILESRELCVSSAIRSRLHSLASIISVLPAEGFSFIYEILMEVILSLKASNSKTRDAGFELLSLMAKTCLRWETSNPSTDSGPSLLAFLHRVAASLALTEPFTISATILALSKLVFEFSDDIGSEFLDFLLKSIVLFLKKPIQEIVKSALVFIKFALIVYPDEVLEPHIGEIIQGLCLWSGERKNKLKIQVRRIFERLLKYYGEEQLRPLIPQEHQALVNYIKREERKRKSALRRAKGLSNADTEDSNAMSTEPSTSSTSGLQRLDRKQFKQKQALEEEIAFEEKLFGSNEIWDSKAKKRLKAELAIASGADRFLRADEAGGDIVDLMDPSSGGLPGNIDMKTATALSLLIAQQQQQQTKGSRSKNKRNLQDLIEGQFPISKDGKLMIGNDDNNNGIGHGGDDDDDDDDDEFLFGSSGRKKKRKTAHLSSTTTSTNDSSLTTYATGSQKDQPINVASIAREQKRKEKKAKADRKKKFTNEILGGSIYRGKGGGDVKIANRPDPFAAVKLTAAQLSRRHSKKTAMTFDKLFKNVKAKRKGKFSNNKRR